MKNDEKDLSNIIKERMKKKDREKAWHLFKLKRCIIRRAEFVNTIQFDFEKKELEFYFRVFIYFEESGFHSVKIDFVMNGTLEEWEDVPVKFKGILKEPAAFKRLYQVIKEEIEYTLQEDPELRMKYLFHKEELIQNTKALQKVLTEMEKRVDCL